MKNGETSLYEVDVEGEEYHLTLMDGSTWFVNPGDLPTVATWLPTVDIKIENSKDGTTFPYELTNLSEYIAIRARKINQRT